MTTRPQTDLDDERLDQAADEFLARQTGSSRPTGDWTRWKSRDNGTGLTPWGRSWKPADHHLRDCCKPGPHGWDPFKTRTHLKTYAHVANEFGVAESALRRRAIERRTSTHPR